MSVLWSITLSTTPKRYDIKVYVERSPIHMVAASATGPGPAWVPKSAAQVTLQTFEYMTSAPWLVSRAAVRSFGGASEESATSYQYDARQLFATQADTVATGPSGASATVRTVAAYDDLGRTVSYNKYTVGDPDAAISATSFAYDAIGRMIEVQRPRQSASASPPEPYTIHFHDSDSNPGAPPSDALKVTITDEEGRILEETYDGLGRFVLAQQSQAGQLVQTAHVQYDSLGRLVKEYDAFGVDHETAHEYDAFGRVIITRYPKEPYQGESERAFSESWHVNAGTLPVASQLPSPPTDLGSVSYSSAVRWERSNAPRTSRTAGDPHPTYRGYDSAGRVMYVVTKTDGSTLPWNVTWYGYDQLDRVTGVWTYRAENTWDRTSYEYGLHFGQPTSMSLPGNGIPEPVHNYSYNSRGLRTAEDPGQPYAIASTYDGLGRLRTATYSHATSPMTTKYGYDHEGRVIKAEVYAGSSLANTVNATYNLRGWLISETWTIDNLTYTIGYEYDDTGNRTKMVLPNGTTFDFQYDGLGRLARIPGYFGEASQPGQAGFSYDANGFLTGAVSTNGIASTYTADARGRLKSIGVVNQQSLEDVLQLAYTYTPQGNISLITGTGTRQFSLSYGYDWLNRLTSADVLKPALTANVGYTYDGAGNRLTESWSDSPMVSYQYLPGNYLASRSKDNTSYAWGPYGQLASKTEAGVTTAYAYNARRLLESVKVGTAPSEKYRYDGLGRRIKTVQGTSATVTLYCGNDVVYEVSGAPYGDSYDNPTIPPPDDKVGPIMPGSVGVYSDAGTPGSNPPGPPSPGPTIPSIGYLVASGKYMAKVAQGAAGPSQACFYHTDQVGSVRAITDSAGQVVARFEYEPFGLTTVATGALAGENHKFTGKPEDETGLYYYGARYYDPGAGRFISRDPAKDGSNWYLYCYGNPLLFIDQYGLWGRDIHLGSVLWGGTFHWAQYNGMFTPQQAEIIAVANNGVDWGSRNPITNQGYHFDLDPGEADSRVGLAEEYLNKAIGYKLMADAARDLGVVNYSESAGVWDEASLVCLGIGLHIVQDTYAHIDEYVEDLTVGGVVYKSHLGNDVPDDPVRNFAGYMKAKEESIKYMQRYLGVIPQ